jgi:hypothetical protein
MMKSAAKRFGRLPRAVQAVALAIVVSAGVIVVDTGAAQASLWQLTDGFDYQPASTWSIQTAGSGGGGFDINAGTARSAPNNAYLWSQTQFSGVGRSVTLRNNSTRTNCGAGVYVNGLSGAKVNFEVIEPASWTYLSLRSVTLTGGGYTQITVPPWSGGPNTVFVRISLLGAGSFNSIRVDDLTVQCIY